MTMKPNSRADHWTRRAGALGYPARSIFKLEKMQRKLMLLRPGKRVLDVGAAPGTIPLPITLKTGLSAPALLSAFILTSEGPPSSLPPVRPFALTVCRCESTLFP